MLPKIDAWHSTAELDTVTELSPADGLAMIDQVGALLAQLSVSFDQCALAAVLQPKEDKRMEFEIHMVAHQEEHKRLDALHAAIQARSAALAQEHAH